MEFWCNGCEIRFVSEPESDELEQAPCPQCSHVSLTYLFELEEARRFVQNNKVTNVMAGGFLTFLLRGLGINAGHVEVPQAEPPILKFQSHLPEPDPFTVSTLSAANEFKKILGEQGIICGIREVAENEYRLILDNRDKKRALKLIDEFE